MRKLRIVFDGPPSHVGGRFVEVEDERGKSIRVGDWHERPDGLYELVIPVRGEVGSYEVLGGDDTPIHASKAWELASNQAEQPLRRVFQKIHKAIAEGQMRVELFDVSLEVCAELQGWGYHLDSPVPVGRSHVIVSWDIRDAL